MKMFPVLVAALFAVSTQAQVTDTRTNDTPNAQATQEKDPKEMADGSWIALSGKVKSVGDEQFVLDHGNGKITVKLQHDDVKHDDHKFIDDEAVRVYGIVDDNFFLNTTILARAVFVESLSSYVYMTDGVDDFIQISTPVIESGTVVHGIVSEVEENKIKLDQGERMITVDTSLLKEGGDPTADVAVAEGDAVTVVGNIDDDFWTGRTLRATTMIPLDKEMEEGEMQGSGRDY